MPKFEQPDVIREGKDFMQMDHQITEPYIDQDNPFIKGAFQGKFIMKKKIGDETKSSGGQMSPKSSDPIIEKDD